MNTTTRPFLKEQIVEALKTAYADIATQITPLTSSTFHRQPEHRWSIANQVEHLIVSSKGIASALKMPKEQLAKFGQPNAPSRDYEGLYKIYYDALAKGKKAPPQFEPKVDSNTSLEQMLNNWNMISDKFEERILQWEEKDLDNYMLPHPAIGMLTMREMLLFTIFHTKHHGETIDKLIGEANV